MLLQRTLDLIYSNGENASYLEVKPVEDWRTHPQDFKLIALTYDDAPTYKEAGENPSTRIIDAISKYEGRGTLFVVGKILDKNGSNLLKYALDKGFQLENHTYMHYSVKTNDIGKEWTADDNYEDFKKCQNLVKSQLGFVMKYLRPSGGHGNQALHEAACRLNLPCIHGNYYHYIRDYKQDTSPETIYDNVMYNAYDGAIIVLHGNNGRTATATERFCETLYNDGFRFCTLDELFRFKGIEHDSLPKGTMICGIDSTTGEILTKDL